MTAPWSSSRYAVEGMELTESTIVRTGGAEDPAGQTQSRRIITTEKANWLRPFRCQPYAIWNETTGADVTVTLYGLAVGALPNTDDIWLEIEYEGDASSTLGTIRTTTKANVLATGTAVASDSSTWGAHAAGNVSFSPATALRVALSGSNLVVTSTLAVGGVGDADQGVRVDSDNGFTGKYYFEALRGTGSGLNFGWSVANPMMIYGALGSATAPGGATLYISGSVYVDGVNTGANVGVIGAGSIVSCAVDLNLRRIWFRKDGGVWNGSGDPVTGVGGTFIPAGILLPFVTMGGTGGTSGATTTLNFGQSAFTYGVPSGFTAGWPNLAATYTPFKLVATLNSPQPGRPGLIHVRPKIGKASATVYLDPKIELTPASATPSATHKSSRYAYEGTETTETSIVRSGGTAHSRKIVTTANSQWLRPYRAEPFAIWNDTVGADVTVTVYGNAATLPLNDEIFMDVEYLNTTHGTIVTTTKANVLATGAAGTSDSSVWAGGTTPFKLVATLSSPQPGQPGLINVRVKAAKPSSTFYLDPTPVLT